MGFSGPLEMVKERPKGITSSWDGNDTAWGLRN